MKKKVISFGAVALLASTLLVGCGNTSSNSTDDSRTEVSMLIGKEEIAKQLDETIDKYNTSQEEYEVKIIPLAGQNATEKITSLYASKNAPVLMNTGVYTELAQWKDKFLDLSDMDLVQHIDQKYLDAGTVDGKVIGIPATIEAFGFLYNKDVLDEAVGGNFDPNSVKSREDLEILMEKIDQLDEKSAIEVSPLDWSLGAHYTNLFFTNQSEEQGERAKFMTDMQGGIVGLSENQVFQNWVDTFDMMKTYNSAAKSPLSADYDSATLALANGDVGLWFMGNWAYPQLKEANPDANIGILPVPLSNEPNAYGNTQISIGVPQTWGIDATQATEEQQAGAKDFLTWLYEDEVGQDYYVNKMGFIPINDNAKVEPTNELSKQILQYLKEDRSLEWMNAHYPPTAFPSMGASLQKYLADDIDRTELAKEIEDYWKTSAE